MSITWIQVLFVLVSNFTIGLYIYLQGKKYRKENDLKHKMFIDEMKKIKKDYKK